jgi:hypothetical protein
LNADVVYGHFVKGLTMGDTKRAFMAIMQKIAGRTKQKVLDVELEFNEDPQAFAEKYSKFLTTEERRLLTGSS